MDYYRQKLYQWSKTREGRLYYEDGGALAKASVEVFVRWLDEDADKNGLDGKLTERQCVDLLNRSLP